MSHHLPRLSVALAVVTAASFGCSSSKEQQQPPPGASAPERTTGADRNEAPAPAIEEPAPAGSQVATEREKTEETIPSPTTTPIADEQSVRILTTINGGEVEQGKVAKQQAKDPRVKKFAAQMIDQHSKAKDMFIKLSKKEQLPPANSSVANDIEDKGAQVLMSLDQVEGADFDKTYMDAQVQQHQAVLELLNTRLIPSANNPQLKAELEDAKKMVERHLKSAQEIQAQMQR